MLFNVCFFPGNELCEQKLLQVIMPFSIYTSCILHQQLILALDLNNKKNKCVKKNLSVFQKQFVILKHQDSKVWSVHESVIFTLASACQL